MWNIRFRVFEHKLTKLHVLWNPEVKYRIRKDLPVIFVVSQIDLIPGIVNYSFS